MMHHKVLIIMAALLGIYQFFAVKNNYSKLILALQVTGIAITFLPVPGVSVWGFTIFTIAGILAAFYPFAQQGIIGAKKGLILLIAVPVVFANIFAICRFPFTGMLNFAMIVPVVACLSIAFTQLKSYKNEIGFLAVLSIDAAIKFLMALEWAFA